MPHTPGPWHFNGSIVTGQDTNGQWASICTVSHSWRNRQIDLANAALIAAAPLMKGQLETGIEALREALRQAASADYDQVHAILSGVIAGNELALSTSEGRP